MLVGNDLSIGQQPTGRGLGEGGMQTSGLQWVEVGGSCMALAMGGAVVNTWWEGGRGMGGLEGVGKGF